MSIRVNTLKISVSEFHQRAVSKGWQLTPIPWCDAGFWIDSDKNDEEFQPGNSGEHLQGLFYIQEASSMLPPIALLADNHPKMILDMAAAPGSKTTQLAALMNNQGTILANELSASRLKVLHANLQRCGVTNTCLSHLDGSKMDQNLGSCFDAILLDAPCGGEGTYRKDPDALNNWSTAALESIASVQKQLLHSAWQMLKPGGRLVYSTCTLSREENQQVLDSLHQSVGDEMRTVNLDNLFPGADKVVTREGYLHVWPEMFDCEGFFVACIEKSPSSAAASPTLLKGQSPFKRLDDKTYQLLQTHYQRFGFDLAPLAPQLKIRNSHREQQIWLFPDEAESLRQSLRLQRSGIRICDLIDSRQGPLIKTQHEFAICFGANFTKGVVELSATQASACFRGENLTLDIEDKKAKGEVIMRYQGIPLGIAKLLPGKKNNNLKNNLPRDLLRSNADFAD